MSMRKRLYKYVKETYQVEPDFPWKKSPNYAILRHKKSQKWFAAVMNISADKLGLDSSREIDVMNVKCDPILKGSLLQEPGVFPAYHMNKEHWLTVLLDGTASEQLVFDLIDISYMQTKK